MLLRRFFKDPSLRRYQTQVPVFWISISPAFFKIFMWCEMVGCASFTLASISLALSPEGSPGRCVPLVRNRRRILRRFGSAMARNARLSLSVAAFIIFLSVQKSFSSSCRNQVLSEQLSARGIRICESHVTRISRFQHTFLNSFLHDSPLLGMS